MKKIAIATAFVLLSLNLVVVGFATKDSWLGLLRKQPAANGDAHAGHAHGEEGHAAHGHAPGSAANQVAIDDKARKNIGLVVQPVELSNYWRSLSMPGVVVERPGKSQLSVTTAVNGVVLRVYASPGQAVRPGDHLLDLQPTGEALATTQASLLRTLKEIDLNAMELQRIIPLAESGSVSGKVKLDLEYEKKRHEANRDVQMQELLVRGLTPAQIAGIVESKKLLQEFTIVVPPADRAVSPAAAPSSASVAAKHIDQVQKDEPVYALERVDVFPGKFVQPGDELCELASHSILMIQGKAFEKEADAVGLAVQKRWPVTAVFDVGEKKREVREGLKILYVDNLVDTRSRTFHFYLMLPNEMIREEMGLDDAIYRTWRFKPGQKVTLRVPVEEWQERIVLPADAIVKEGLGAYVFRANGTMMERVSVHIEYQDSSTVVISNDGSVFPGDEVAMNNGYQLNLALKKQMGSGVDPHAGHNH